jgi:hypothetical protein
MVKCSQQKLSSGILNIRMVALDTPHTATLQDLNDPKVATIFKPRFCIAQPMDCPRFCPSVLCSLKLLVSFHLFVMAECRPYGLTSSATLT